MTEERTQLPAGWNDEIDLLVVTGADARRAAELLAARGLRRVLAVADGEPVRGAWVEHTEAGIRRVCRGMLSQPPQRVVYAERGAPVEDLPSPADVRRWVDDTIARIHMSRNTQNRFGPVWARQTIESSPEIIRCLPAGILEAEAAGKPMVVVCPGPSLTKNIDQVRALQGRAVIVAVSHALHAVNRAGIVADVVVSVDPSDLRMHYEGVDPSAFRVAALDIGVHPALFRLGRRPPIVYAANGLYAQWLLDVLGHPLEGIAAGGSVTHAAASFGLRWRCDPIVFVGMDLSFPGGRMYADTSIDSKVRIELSGEGRAQAVGYDAGTAAVNRKMSGGDSISMEVVDAPGWDGVPVKTSRSFEAFRVWFEELATACPGQRFINATEGGVHVRGFEHRRLAEVIAELPQTVTVDVEGALRAAEQVSSFADRAARLERALSAHRRACAEAEVQADRCVKMIDRSRVGLEKAFTARLEGRRSSAADEAALDNLEQRLEKKVADAVRPLEDLTLALQFPIRAVQRESANGTPRAKFRLKRELHRMVAETAREMKKACDTSLAQLRATRVDAPSP